MVLGKIPLITFLITCIMVHAIITRHNKDRKAIIAAYYSMGIGSFFMTFRSLNKIYFLLTKSAAIIVDMIAITCTIITIILIIYIQMTKKDKHPYGKLPKL